MSDDVFELTAWHESGHATMAILEGGFLERVTIEPPNDDGPRRYGDTITRWSGLTQQQYVLAEIRVSLAGPIAEMLYSGFREPIQSVAEWQADWMRAKSGADAFGRRSELVLKQIEDEVTDLFENVNVWASIGAVADDLLAHETLEHEQVKATIDFWRTK